MLGPMHGKPHIVTRVANCYYIHVKQTFTGMRKQYVNYMTTLCKCVFKPCNGRREFKNGPIVRSLIIGCMY